MRKLLMLLMLLCSGVTSVNAQYESRIIGRDWVLNPIELPTRWRRPDDPLSGHMKFLINEFGEICMVPDSDYVIVMNGSMYKCPRWRKPRGY